MRGRGAEEGLGLVGGPRSGVLLLGTMASYEGLFGRCESDLGCGISSYDAIEG